MAEPGGTKGLYRSPYQYHIIIAHVGSLRNGAKGKKKHGKSGKIFVTNPPASCIINGICKDQGVTGAVLAADFRIGVMFFEFSCDGFDC